MITYEIAKTYRMIESCLYPKFLTPTVIKTKVEFFYIIVHCASGQSYEQKELYGDWAQAFEALAKKSK